MALRLHETGVPVVGVPKTIDNDLGGTDVTFGFQTAVQIVTDAIDRLHTTAESHNRVMVLEVMGRHAGWIATHAGLAGGADAILVPERPFDIEQRRRAPARAATSAGAASRSSSSPRARRRARARCRCARARRPTPSATPASAGSASRWRARWSAARAIESRVTILGHVQRGGTPVAFDRVLATRFGVAAMDAALAGRFGAMVGAARHRDRRDAARRGAARAQAARPRAVPRRRSCSSASTHARDDVRAGRAAAADGRARGARAPGCVNCCCACTPAASAARTCTCSTARWRSSSRRASSATRSSRRSRAPARATRRRSKWTIASACHGSAGPTATCAWCRSGRENLCPQCALHRLRHRRRIRRVRGRRRALLLPDPGGLPGRAGGAADVRGADRLSRAAHVRRGAPDRLVRLRRLGAHPRAGVQLAGARGLRLHARRAIEQTQAFARELGAVWAGGSEDAPPEPLDAAIIFAPVGALVPLALAAVAPGGTVVCGGIYMSEIPSFPYSALWQERSVRSVANLTRADGARVPGARAAGAGPHARHDLPARAGQRGARGPARRALHRRGRARSLNPPIEPRPV